MEIVLPHDENAQLIVDDIEQMLQLVKSLSVDEILVGGGGAQDFLAVREDSKGPQIDIFGESRSHSKVNWAFAQSLQEQSRYQLSMKPLGNFWEILRQPQWKEVLLVLKRRGDSREKMGAVSGCRAKVAGTLSFGYVCDLFSLVTGCVSLSFPGSTINTYHKPRLREEW